MISFKKGERERRLTSNFELFIARLFNAEVEFNFQNGCLKTEIGNARLYTLPGVINFHACWYFVSLVYDLTDGFGQAGAI